MIVLPLEMANSMVGLWLYAQEKNLNYESKFK